MFGPGGEFRREQPDHRVIQQVYGLNRHAERLADPHGAADGKQRVAAQVEEVVVTANSLPPEQLRPQAGDGGLGVADGRRVAVFRLLPARQPGPVDLAVDRHRPVRDQHHVPRHHRAGQVVPQVPGDLGGKPGVGTAAGGLVTGNLRVADEPQAVGGLVGEHERRRDTRVPRQDSLDLPRLDAHAPDLDLVVTAAEEQQLAIGAVAGEVSRAVKALSRAKRRGDEPARGQGTAAEVSVRERRSRR